MLNDTGLQFLILLKSPFFGRRVRIALQLLSDKKPQTKISLRTEFYWVFHWHFQKFFWKNFPTIRIIKIVIKCYCFFSHLDWVTEPQFQNVNFVYTILDHPFFLIWKKNFDVISICSTFWKHDLTNALCAFLLYKHIDKADLFMKRDSKWSWFLVSWIKT